MEKIFDIAKDSEQKWGVIAQGIDGNFEELSLKVDGTRRITGKDFYNGVYEYGTGIKDSRYNVVCGPLKISVGEKINIVPSGTTKMGARIFDSENLTNATTLKNTIDILSEYEYISEFDGYILFSANDTRGVVISAETCTVSISLVNNLTDKINDKIEKLEEEVSNLDINICCTPFSHVNTTIVNDCQHSDSYELSNGEIDATNKLLWNHSLHINNGNVVFKINPINLVDNVLSLKMMINSIASSEKSVEVKIYNNTEPNNYYVYELMRANVNTVYGTWREYTIPSLAYWYKNGKSVNLESIDRISISGVNCDFNVQYVGIKSNRLKKGIVTFTFDDGYKSQALAMKALAERGLSGTIFAIKDTFSYGDDSEFLNLNGFREVVDKYNADIQCHGVSSFDDMLDDDELATYMQQTKQILIDNGLGKGDYMAYPNGFHSDRVVNIAKRFFKACRTIQNYIPMETYPPYDLYRIRAYSNITSSSTDKIKQLIDRSVASGAWLILVYHRIEDGETGMYCSLESLEEVIDYAVNSGIRIMNFKDVFESGVVI
jgi:peptidoglycan/xylan/chitin deacetylase (PgdA/CDA1 family)|nr:MAG TPA: hypothetical protein [Caudoviricetes sp.]